MKARNVILGVIFILVGIYFIARAGHKHEDCNKLEGCERLMVRKAFVGHSSHGENGCLIAGVVLVIIGGCFAIFSSDRKRK